MSSSSSEQSRNDFASAERRVKFDSKTTSSVSNSSDEYSDVSSDDATKQQQRVDYTSKKRRSGCKSSSEADGYNNTIPPSSTTRSSSLPQVSEDTQSASSGEKQSSGSDNDHSSSSGIRHHHHHHHHVGSSNDVNSQQFEQEGKVAYTLEQQKTPSRLISSGNTEGTIVSMDTASCKPYASSSGTTDRSRAVVSTDLNGSAGVAYGGSPSTMMDYSSLGSSELASIKQHQGRDISNTTTDNNNSSSDSFDNDTSSSDDNMQVEETVVQELEGRIIQALELGRQLRQDNTSLRLQIDSVITEIQQLITSSNTVGSDKLKRLASETLVGPEAIQLLNLLLSQIQEAE